MALGKCSLLLGTLCALLAVAGAWLAFDDTRLRKELAESQSNLSKAQEKIRGYEDERRRADEVFREIIEEAEMTLKQRPK
jgi:hypothetical protein